MLAARTMEGVDLTLVRRPQSTISTLLENNLISIKDNKLIPTLEGWMVLNALVLELI
jgi:hypothetical protein